MEGDHFYTMSAIERDVAIRSYGYVSEGIACAIFTKPWTARTGDHAYYVSEAQRDTEIHMDGYVDEGIACYVHPTAAAGSVPLYHLLQFSSWDNFYTTSTAERDNAVTSYNYTYADIQGFVHNTQVADSVPLFRLRSLTNGDHFYTISAFERDNAVQNYHYVSEGIQAYVFPTPASGRVPLLRIRRVSDPLVTEPLLRLCSAQGDHFYTTSQAESQNALLQLGYRAEGVAGHVQTAAATAWGAQPLFRLRSLTNGDHFYTISAFERDNAVQNYHYVSEGTAGWVWAPWVTPLFSTADPLGSLYRLRNIIPDPPMPPMQPLTCDGKPVGAATQTYAFVAQDNITKGLSASVISVVANSSADAQACAQKTVNQASAHATAVPLSAISLFFFGVRVDTSCSTIQARNTSSADAITWLKTSYCSNCSYDDITAEVTNPDGSIDGSALDHWCDDH